MTSKELIFKKYIILKSVHKTQRKKMVFVNTGWFEMIVGVLTTCHTQYTWDSSICSCTDGSRNSQSFLLWCAVGSSYAFLRLERGSLRWRRTAVRRRFVCLHFLNVGQLQLLRQGSGLCSASPRKYPGTEGTNHNRRWNHHRWHATDSLERTRLSCWCL